MNQRVAKASGPAGTALCEALGLDPKSVRSLVINCTASHLIVVSCELFVNEGQTKKLVSALKQYHLTPAADVDDVTSLSSSSREFQSTDPAAEALR